MAIYMGVIYHSVMPTVINNLNIKVEVHEKKKFAQKICEI